MDINDLIETAFGNGPEEQVAFEQEYKQVKKFFSGLTLKGKGLFIEDSYAGNQFLPLDYFKQMYKATPVVVKKEKVDIHSIDYSKLTCLHYSEVREAVFSTSEPGGGLPVLFRLKDGILVYLLICNAEKLRDVYAYTLSTIENAEEARQWIDNLKYQQEAPILPQISYIVAGGQSLGFRSRDIVERPLELDYYNDGFDKIDEDVKAWAQDWTDTGLAVFHGQPGTGKTSYIRHLASKLRNVTYIPSGLTAEIGSPTFLTFLADWPERIYVIEDAENVVVSDDLRRTPALQNLLNATDGLMGDIIRSKFILTFNTDLDNVDSALIRPGRAQVIYKFEKLVPEKAAALLRKLNRQQDDAPEMSLAEVFNAPIKGAKGIKKKRERIGF